MAKFARGTLTERILSRQRADGFAEKNLPFAICNDFDRTLAPGNMQERDFIPAIGMTTREFWDEVRAQSERHQADNILVYMWLMLRRANAEQVQVRKKDFETFGKKVPLFPGVTDWFKRIDVYGQESGVKVQYYIISSGIREMIAGSPIHKHFSRVYASSFIYDHHGVANWPAMALNYTTKLSTFLGSTKPRRSRPFGDQRLRPHEGRPMPFKHMVFIGDGETDVPCFRLVKDQGDHSIAVYKPRAPKTKARADRLLKEGRVNFLAPADYTEGKQIDQIIKATIDKVAADRHLYGGW